MVTSLALDGCRGGRRAGATTADLDTRFVPSWTSTGRAPTPGYHGYPATVCTSVNDEVVHGIPGSGCCGTGHRLDRRRRRGRGWHGDSARTVLAGTTHDPADQQLSDVTRAAMWRGHRRDGHG
ncbi:M24 family metallopeptidase [Kocuria rhizophila]|nr:M24 family metallopeptidase [Kocuria rhizophila]